MTDNIIRFPGLTTVDLDPVDVLEAAKQAELEHVIVIGFHKDDDCDDPIYIAGTTADLGLINLMIDMAKNQMLHMTNKFKR